MFLDGLGVAGYRSFGEELEFIGPLAKVNLIAGQNNSGKSNVLRFINYMLPQALAGATTGKGHTDAPDPLDQHQPTRPAMRFAFGIRIGGDLHSRITDGIAGGSEQARHEFERVLDALADGSGMAWICFRWGHDRERELVLDPEWLAGPVAATPSGSWDVLSQLLTSSRGGLEHNVKATIRALFRNHVTTVPVAFVPAVRDIGREGEGTELTGADLIQRLAVRQNPPYSEWGRYKHQFESINRFLRTVTGVDNAELEIPNDRDTIHVTLGAQVLPLENLGSGIHEVTMLAAWATLFENQIVCIEEPELHLHPLLQRKLLAHLAAHTSNQYFITTHSAHLLDSPGCSVSHVRHDDGHSRISNATTDTHRVELCADLGYRSSDLLQANAVIWVEGPSDRLYIRHWLEAVEPDLIEGVHYSLMFYGGRLLSHLSASDVEVDDFIGLRRINQWLSVVIDSDRKRAGGQINATKRRVRDEVNGGPGMAWVTKGREIENYVNPMVMSAAIAKSHPSAAARTIGSFGQYVDATWIRVGGKTRSMDKLKVAHHVVAEPPDLSVLDLRRNISALANFVVTANSA